MSDSSWDWGECSTKFVDAFLSSELDGTFLVYKTPDKKYLTLAIRFKGENKYVRIYNEVDLYGFTEPLGFESLEDALDAYNWSPTETGNTLIYPAVKPDSPIKRTYSRSSRSSLNEARPLHLFKDLQSATKLKMEKDEEYAIIQKENDSLDKKLLEITNSLDSINCLIKILEAQIEKSNTVRFRSTVRTRTSELFDKNFHELTVRLSDLSGEKRQLNERASNVQVERNKVEKQQARLYKELQETVKDINAFRRALLRKNPKFGAILDCLMNEDVQCNTDVKVHNINRSAAETMLESTNDGTYVVRAGDKGVDKPYVISVRYQAKIHHFLVMCYEGCFGLEEDTCIFASINELVNLYSQVPFSVHNNQYEALTLCQQKE